MLVKGAQGRISCKLFTFGSSVCISPKILRQFATLSVLRIWVKSTTTKCQQNTTEGEHGEKSLETTECTKICEQEWSIKHGNTTIFWISNTKIIDMSFISMFLCLLGEY